MLAGQGPSKTGHALLSRPSTPLLLHCCQDVDARDKPGHAGQSSRERHMAEIVAGFGVPHTPIFPFFVQRDGPDCETAVLFRKLTEHLEQIKPDLIVMFDTDHMNTFFLDNLPIFAVGVGDDFTGPNDEVRSVPVQTVKSRGDVATHLRNAAVRAGQGNRLMGRGLLARHLL